MNYYEILGFSREPFSTSPDPDFLYMSKEHETALTNTLIELNLRRGLNVILGDIGTGKTTLSRKLIQELAKREKFVFQIILNPSFENERQFMRSLMHNYDIPIGQGVDDDLLLGLRESFYKFLLGKTIEENRVVVLIIDEAQKLNAESLEMLRVLLNYETNDFKLIQIVLLGQMELYSKISGISNFYDRINFKYTLNPFNLEEAKLMIVYRLQQAGYNGKMHLFLDEAIREIHRHSGGYPRRITMLCHRALKALILRNKYVVDAQLVRLLVEEDEKLGWKRKIPQGSLLH